MTGRAGRPYARRMITIVDGLWSATIGRMNRRKRAAVGQRIAEEYAARPQTDAEISWADAGTVAMIAEEPWERL